MGDLVQLSERMWKKLLEQGIRAMETGNVDTAEVFYAQAFAKAPGDPKVCLAFGKLKDQLGEYEDAEVLFRRAWRADQTSVEAAAGLARLWGIHNKEIERAHALIVEATVLNGRQAELETVRSELLVEQELYEEALDVAESAIRLATEQKKYEMLELAKNSLARAVNQLGIQHARDGSHTTAVFTFKRAVDLDPNWSSPRVNMGAAFASIGKRQKARKCYEEAIELDPANGVAHYNLGLWFRETGNLEMATERFEEAVAQEPNNADAWVQLGLCVEKQDPTRAQEYWRTALNIDPSNPDASRFLGN